jgi:hypothetical protein
MFQECSNDSDKQTQIHRIKSFCNMNKTILANRHVPVHWLSEIRNKTSTFVRKSGWSVKKLFSYSATQWES